MARSATAKAEAAADAVEAFLRDRRRADATVEPGEAPAAVASDRRVGDMSVDGADGVAPSVPMVDAGRSVHPSHTDWLRHRLTVSGPEAAIKAFRAAACGAGTIPWQLDLASLEEDWFHRLVDPAHRSLSLQGARMLAAQLREAVERRHALAVARVGHSRACALDLHALVPVPPEILALGPDHPRALGWLWKYWGTTQGLRHVGIDVEEGRRGRAPAGPGWHLQFWSADWTPWRALARIRADWPELRFDVQPDYE